MLKTVVCFLFIFSSVTAMQPDPYQVVKICACDADRGARVLAFLPLQVARQCAIIDQSIELCNPRLNMQPLPSLSSHGYQFFVPSELSSFKLWQKLQPCLENTNEVKKILQNPEELGAVLKAANYLGHEELFNVCASDWAGREYGADQALDFPAEVQAAISRAIFLKHNVDTVLLRYGVQETKIGVNTFAPRNVKDVWACAIASDGESVAVGYEDGNIYYWIKKDDKWKRHAIVHAHEGKSIGRLQFIEGNKKLISSGLEKGIKIWDLVNEVCLLAFGDAESNGFFSTYEDANKLLAIPTQVFAIHLYVLKNVSLAMQNPDQEILPVMQLVGHTDTINALDFSPTKDLLASVAEDKLCMLWNLLSGNLCNTFELPGRAFSVKFNSQGNQLALGLDQGTLQIYDIRQGSLAREQKKAHEKYIWGCVFAREDSLLFTGSEDGMIKVWIPSSLECLRVLNMRAGGIFFMDHNEEHDKLVAGFGNGSLCLFDLKKFIKELKGQQLALKYDFRVEQACFLVKAAQATAQNKLICTGEYGRVFNSFSKETRSMLVKNFSLVVPDGQAVLEAVAKKLKTTLGSK